MARTKPLHGNTRCADCGERKTALDKRWKADFARICGYPYVGKAHSVKLDIHFDGKPRCEDCRTKLGRP